MEEDKIYFEIIKEGIKIAGRSLANHIPKVNKKRLEEKKEKRLLKGKNDTKEVKLNSSEKIDGDFNLNIEKASNNVQEHVNNVKRWARNIKFGDLQEKKTLGSVYIQLDTYLVPARRHYSSNEKKKSIPLEKAILSGKDHSIILGQPGAGKTTSLKKICDYIIKKDGDHNYIFPILLRLRDLGDLNSSTPILDHISRIIPFEFNFSSSLDSGFSFGVNDLKQEAIFAFLNTVKPIIILDGFDELKDDTTKNTILNELRNFTKRLTDTKLVLSCRTGEFNYELEFSKTFEIAPLNDRQIEVFVNKWLNDKEKANDFLVKVKSSPFADTSIKPLSLAHLCVIYERIGNVPDQPKTIYRKVVNLLIEEWDEQRSIVRESSFSGFQADKKFEFLIHLAFIQTVTYHSSIFTIAQLKKSYEMICDYHGLPKQTATNVIRELESHTGLFIESGYETFEFVHKSIQEYLTAEYIVKLISPNTIKRHFEYLGAELAIAVSISSNSSLYFVELILNYFLKLTLPNSFYNTFTSRIVSENPTFNQDELVSVASLVMLSKWINPESKNYSNILTENLSEQLYSSFFSLSRSLKLKEQTVKIFKYYEYVQGVQGNILVELRRIKEPMDHKRLPSKVYIPNELYQEFI